MIASCKPQFLLADSDAASRRRIASLLSNAFPEARTTAARSFEDVVNHLENHVIDVVIAAFHIEGQSILPVIERAGVANWPARFLIFSELGELHAGVPCIRMGASGFIPKQAPVADFVAAVRSVLIGRFFMSDSLVSALAEGGSAPDADLTAIGTPANQEATHRPGNTQARPSRGGAAIQIPSRGAAMRWSDGLSIPF